MAISINKVILVGRLGKDPETRGRDGGFVAFSLATSRSWRDKSSGERREVTQWHNVTVFNEQAANFSKTYLKKSDLVYVEGELETRQYEKDGATHYATDVVVRPFTGSVQAQSKDGGGSGGERRDDAPAERADRGAASSGGRAAGRGAFEALDDDIPF